MSILCFAFILDGLLIFSFFLIYSEKAAQDFEELVATIMKKDEKPVESSSDSDDPDCADGLKFEFKVEISRIKPRNGKLPQTDKEIQRMKRIKKWMEKTGE